MDEIKKNFSFIKSFNFSRRIIIICRLMTGGIQFRLFELGVELHTLPLSFIHINFNYTHLHHNLHHNYHHNFQYTYLLHHNRHNNHYNNRHNKFYYFNFLYYHNHNHHYNCFDFLYFYYFDY